MTAPVAPCMCRLKETTNRTEIDSNGCLLNPILDAFSKIQAMAAEISADEHRTPRTRSALAKSSRKPGTGTWSVPWATAKAALKEFDRVMQLEKIPQSSFHCDLCSKEIDEGALRVFHGSCYDERFEHSTNTRHLKETIGRTLPPGNAVRELVPSFPDEVPGFEMTGVMLAIIHLFRIRQL